MSKCNWLIDYFAIFGVKDKFLNKNLSEYSKSRWLKQQKPLLQV